MNMHAGQQDTWLYEKLPHIPFFERIPHYYGDTVRVLFIVTAILMLAGAPFYTDSLMQQMPLIVVGGVALIAAAALISPRSVNAVRMSAVFAGVIAVVYEIWALWGYEGGSAVNFVLREVPALLGMFAFYYSMKTLRSMLTGMVGKASDELVEDEKLLERAEMREGVVLDGLNHPAALEDDMGEM